MFYDIVFMVTARQEAILSTREHTLTRTRMRADTHMHTYIRCLYVRNVLIRKVKTIYSVIIDFPHASAKMWCGI